MHYIYIYNLKMYIVNVSLLGKADDADYKRAGTNATTHIYDL